jgi:hypothetical protein
MHAGPYISKSQNSTWTRQLSTCHQFYFLSKLQRHLPEILIEIYGSVWYWTTLFDIGPLVLFNGRKLIITKID